MKRILFLLFSLISITSQAQVSLGGYIQPLNNSSYPVQIDSLGKGGYVVAKDTIARNAITCLRRKYGMAVYVQKNQSLYILKDSACNNIWSLFTGGGLSDTVYTQSPIMSRTSGDSNIIYFNPDTANAWRGGTGGGGGVGGTGSKYYVPRWLNDTTLQNSQIFDSVNVGIGTITPAHKLDVNGAINIAGGTEGTTGFLRISSNGTPVSVQSAYSDYMLLNNAKYVGGANQWEYLTNSGASKLSMKKTGFQFSTAVDGIAGGSIPWNNLVTMLSTGNVGINIDTPKTGLHLKNKILTIEGAEPTSGINFIRPSNGANHLIAINNSDLAFYTVTQTLNDLRRTIQINNGFSTVNTVPMLNLRESRGQIPTWIINPNDSGLFSYKGLLNLRVANPGGYTQSYNLACYNAIDTLVSYVKPNGDGYFLGDLLIGNLATGTGQADKMVTVDSVGKLKTQNIPTGTSAIDSIYRTIGKDSIFYKKNGNTYAIKDSVGSNPSPVGYYGAFQDTLSQTLPLANTAYPIKARITDLSNGVFLADSTRFVFNNAGIYNLQWSGQFQNTDNAVQDARVWVRKNNVDIIGTTGLISIHQKKSASEYGHNVAGWNFLLDVNAGDTLQFYWSATSTSVSLEYYPIGTVPPSPTTASMVVTITQQSGIMAGTGITGLGTTGNLQSGANQILATSASGNDFTITSAGNTQTFNIPNASTSSSVTRGLISNTQYNTFNNKLGATDTVSLSNRINNKQTNLDLLQSLGWGVKAEPYGCSYANVTSTLALTSTGISFYPFNWNVSDSIRGIAFFNRLASTAVTPSNYNGVAIYKLVGTDLVRQTFTTNSGTFWDNAVANTWKTQAITPFFLAKGTYYLGYQASATSGLPTIASGTIMQTGFIEPPSAVNTNGIKISCSIPNNTTSPPSSVVMVSTTTVQRVPYFIIY